MSEKGKIHFVSKEELKKAMKKHEEFMDKHPVGKKIKEQRQKDDLKTKELQKEIKKQKSTKED
ncbi:MAG: PTS system mannose/fructose/sorbose family transporter subunit IID [Candidatus Heimdallarchaeota archaeon]|nr:PTS system mannose/fructose/sorbose family transporter subunit IID [Candidatus Heimdallarchaeota archaeon]